MTRPAGLLVVVALALVACDPPNPYPADTFPEYVVVNRCGYAVQVTGLDETRVLQADETATYLMSSGGAEFTYEISLPDDASTEVSFTARVDRVELAGTRCPIG